MTETAPQPTDEQSPSSAYLSLLTERRAAEERGRSGSHAIARAALRALQAGEITLSEHATLFPDAIPAPRSPEDSLSTERPPRPLDHAELAAGEGVRHPDEDDDDTNILD